MKKLEIIIRPEKLEDLKAILEESNVNGLNIANIMGYGNQKGVVKRYRGAEYRVNLLPKIKVETVDRLPCASAKELLQGLSTLVKANPPRSPRISTTCTSPFGILYTFR